MPTFYDRFRECAERWPQNRALEIQRRDRTESYTYAETREKAESIGRWLTENGFQNGVRLAILADNHPRWVAAYLGAIAAGCTAVPLDTAFRADQVAKLLKDSGSALLFADAKHLPSGQSAVAELNIPIVLVSAGTSTNTQTAEHGSRRTGQSPVPTQATPAQPVANLDDIFAAGPGNFSPVESSADSLASLLYTSGTTADPKGVMLTHANLLGEVESVFARLDIGPADAVLGVLPLFHVLSQMANLLLPLVKGARVVYLETLNTTELLRALQERQITAFAVVPQFFYLIHDRIFKEIERRGSLARHSVQGMMAITRLARRFGWNAGKLFFRPIHKTFGDKMRYLITGGSRFDPQIGRDFYALGIDVLQAYGLTETTGAAFLTAPNDNVIGSVGPPLLGVEGKIIDPQPQEEGGPATGEIAIRGAIVMKGYWNRADATAAVLKDGWLITGDLGHFDSRGNLFITGRQKDVIVLSNGKNIYPDEIEAHYSKSSYIKQICVMGLEARPGDPTSERLHAVIVPNFETLKRQRIANAKEVIRFDIENLSAKFPSTKRVGSYEIWSEDLPQTTTRKLKRFEIEKRVRANQARVHTAEAEVASERPLSADDTAWLEQPEVQCALKIVRDSSKSAPDVIHPGDNLELDLSFDSMQRVELLVALEKELGGDVEESRLAEIYTVRDLVDTIRESAAGGKAIPRAQFAGWKALLQEESTDPEVLALARQGRFAEHVFYGLSRLIQIFASDRLDLQVTGLEKLPIDGPYILSSNHQSFVDPVILSSVLPWPVFRHLFSGGTSEIFGSGPMRVLARWLRVMVLDPDVNLVPALRAGIFGLRHGRVLILYPEGERSIDGTPRTFKKGAAILSVHAQVPIVPVAIEGFYEVWPRGKKFFQKFAPVQVRFGDPIYPPPESEASEAVYEHLTAELRARVVAMWEELRAAHRGSA
jgi:long-chain acyl-CoA synthetase